MREKRRFLTRTALLCAVFATVVLAVFGLLHGATTAQAGTTQPENAAVFPSRAASLGPSDPKELEAFLDEYLNEWMEKAHIPGLVFVLVKGGDVFLAKGYGYSDLEKKKAVIPDKTLFRVGSVSKLFTATAIMQLSEQGLLQLDTDVNKYLKRFQLDEDYPEPVTMANLLTHSAGFRGGAIGSSIKKESEVIPLKDYLSVKKILRAMPPGQVINYSNYGYNLAGYVVEEVSGVPFAEYIDKSILGPLGMEQSSFDLKPDQAPELARSYSFENGSYEVLPHEYGLSWPAPCGSLIGTATDMARFMSAHLQDNRYGDSQILNAETAREMHQQHFTNHPKLPGTCYGFYEYYGNNQRAIFHDGDLSGFSSRMILMPDQNLGFFVCYNGGPSGFRMQLTTAFLNRYYPDNDQATSPQPTADFGNRAELFAGSYRSVRQDINSLDKLRSITALINIAANHKGIIWTNTQSQWVEIEPLLFQYAEGKSRMAFREDSKGKITHLFLDLQQMPIAYERVAWYDMPALTWSSLGFFGFVFLSSFATWPIMHRRRGSSKDKDASKSSYRLPRLLAIFTVILNSVFILIFSLFMIWFADMLEYGVPFVIKALLVIPIITSIFTAALLLFALLAWVRGYWNLAERSHYTLVTLTCTALVFWCYNWNLLGFHY
jgi:CubicO group peptidase (beta-lactamase class C family)